MTDSIYGSVFEAKMNILRQDTDYALRAMANLAAKCPGTAVSTRRISCDEGIAYHFAAKIMQKLHAAGLVNSTMGPKGGFSLAKSAERITLLEVVGAMQGDVTLNTCFLRSDPCPRCTQCMISRKTAALQDYIEKFLDGISLAELVDNTAVGVSVTERIGQ